MHAYKYKKPLVASDVRHGGGTIPYAHWRRYHAFFKRQIPTVTRDWLLDTGSLTQRLIRVCGRRPFRVKLLGESYRYVSLDEAYALGVPNGTRVVMREVQLLCNEIPWVYARSLIPVTSLQGRLRRLKQQGSRSLGSTLFAERTLRRGPLEICRAGSTEIPGGAGGMANKSVAVWGRRSVFYVQDLPLLVSEYFLPALLSD